MIQSLIMHRSDVYILMVAVVASTVSSARIRTTTTTTTPEPEEIDQGDPFQYSYFVDADANSTRVEQSKAETSNGQEVVGQYKVLLPDGRLQTVTYTSGPDGYKATVKYAQVGQSVTNESSGRSFTTARPAPTTSTTTTTTTTTKRPTSIAAIASTQSAGDAQLVKEQVAIDGRTSTSSRSRQRSNRTRQAERLRWPQDTSLSTNSDVVDSLPSFKSANIEPTVRSRPAGGLKTTWTFDKSRHRPEEIFSQPEDYDED